MPPEQPEHHQTQVVSNAQTAQPPNNTVAHASIKSVLGRVCDNIHGVLHIRCARVASLALVF